MTSASVSRSIVANRLNEFASLYDPGVAINHESDQRSGALHERFDINDELVSVPLTLSKSRYRQYRLGLVATSPTCTYCGDKLDRQTGTLDHVLPESRGGRDHPANLRLCCKRCNCEKEDQTAGEWLESMRKELASLRDRISRLTDLIENDGLECFKPTRARTTIPRQAKPDQKAGRDQSHLAYNLTTGRKKYWIADRTTGRRIISGLSLSALIHYLKATGDNSEIVAVEYRLVFNKELGLYREPDLFD